MSDREGSDAGITTLARAARGYQVEWPSTKFLNGNRPPTYLRDEEGGAWGSPGGGARSSRTSWVHIPMAGRCWRATSARYRNQRIARLPPSHHRAAKRRAGRGRRRTAGAGAGRRAAGSSSTGICNGEISGRRVPAAGRLPGPPAGSPAAAALASSRSWCRGPAVHKSRFCLGCLLPAQRPRPRRQVRHHFGRAPRRDGLSTPQESSAPVTASRAAPNRWWAVPPISG